MYLTDKLGSVRDIIDNTGAVVKHLDYDSFGAVVNDTNPTFDDRYKFTAREWDEILGLQYSRQRFYDPAMRRFISQDPIGFDAGDANLYRYVGNGPTNATDPTGEMEWEDVWAGLRTVATFAAPLPFALRAYFDADGLARDLDRLSGGASTQTLASDEFGAVHDAVDGFVAGWGDGLTLGGSTWLREQIWGTAATRNHQGGWFIAGQVVGTVHSAAITFGAGASVQAGRAGLWAIQAGRAYTWTTTGVGVTRSSYTYLFDRENFGWQNTLDFIPLAGFGLRKLTNLLKLTRPCFTGEMEILARRGWVRWDELTGQDQVASCDEHDPNGPIVWKSVEEIFRRFAPI